jgi:hypothetical protein
MTTANVVSTTAPPRSEQVPRWMTPVTWVAVLAPLLYSCSRALWALGVPVGIHEKGLDEIGVPGLGGSTYVLGLALASATVGVVTYRVALRDRRRLPRLFPLLGGRQLPPFLLIAVAALISAFLLTTSFGAESPLKPFTDPEGFRRSIAPEGWGPTWAFWAQEALFLAWGLSLAIVTFVYWRRVSRRSTSRTLTR